jgi:hypothetical protein
MVRKLVLIQTKIIKYKYRKIIIAKFSTDFFSWIQVTEKSESSQSSFRLAAFQNIAKPDHWEPKL